MTQPSPRPVTDPARMIQDFTVYDLGAEGWRAVHREDPDVVIEHERWDILNARAMGARVRLHLLGLWGASSWSEAIAGEHHTEAGS